MRLASPLATLVIFAVLGLGPGHARAWIYPEHRQIGVEAFDKLSPEGRAFYEALWQRARVGYSAGLCETPVAKDQPAPGSDELRSPCIDFAAWPAIAGDHSCSPDELIDKVLPDVWIHDVARVSHEVDVALHAAEDLDAHENVWITSNLQLQNVDPEYVTRAGANNAHFLLPMEGDDLSTFIAHSMREGAPLNALGLYVQYHVAALRLARAIGPDAQLAGSVLARKVLSLEAYALHFLQDMFASGHVAGTWGDTATRKGTHDYYCAHGYATSSWAGDNLVMFGDAHMQPLDLARSGRVIAASLEQVMRAAAAAPPGYQAADADVVAVGALDSCQLLVHPKTIPLEGNERAAIETLLRDTPRPGHGPDSVAWPRYRADFGLFAGVDSSVALGFAGAGYGTGRPRAFAEFGMALRVGFGLEGVVASVNTGTMYAQFGLARQSEQLDFCVPACERNSLGSQDFPRVPSRGGISFGLRMPFWLIPGDLLVLAPVLGLVAPSELTRVAIRAASGGLIPWQRTFASPIGHVEFVAGRVVYLTLWNSARAFSYYDLPDKERPQVGQTDFRSLTLQFPIVELTPFRTFAQTLSASAQIQLSYALEIPYGIKNVRSELFEQHPTPDWPAVHTFMLRLSVNGRGYL